MTECKIPKDKGLDNTLKMIKEGYLFMPLRMKRYNSDIFETNIMGKKAICIGGSEGAKVFYNPELFKRKGVAPKRIQKTLFGENAIQGKDGMEHKRRKSLFMKILTEEEEEKIGGLIREELVNSIAKWEVMGEVVLFKELSEIICYVVCNWTGIKISRVEAVERAEDFIMMIYSFASLGSKYRQGKKAREKTEKWVAGIVEDVRNGESESYEDSPLYKISFYKEADGKLLQSKMAAIEIINVIRPMAAISTYIVFAALALETHPECREKFIENEDNYREMFSEEVRRFYPFTPFVGAKAKKDFLWEKYKFKVKKGKLVLLDIYGIDHDERIWDEPYEFKPERFKKHKEDLFDFVPQGGGNMSVTHRCPGEGVTIKVMERVMEFLLKDINFKVKKQDLSYSLEEIPTLPRSGFVVSEVMRN